MEFKDKLLCPSCKAELKDIQSKAYMECKEEFCGKCGTQFGYEEERHINFTLYRSYELE